MPNKISPLQTGQAELRTNPPSYHQSWWYEKYLIPPIINIDDMRYALMLDILSTLLTTNDNQNICGYITNGNKRDYSPPNGSSRIKEIQSSLLITPRRAGWIQYKNLLPSTLMVGVTHQCLIYRYWLCQSIRCDLYINQHMLVVYQTIKLIERWRIFSSPYVKRFKQNRTQTLPSSNLMIGGARRC